MDLIREQWTAENYQDFVGFLLANQDISYREFHKKLVPGMEESLIGIRVPVLWKMARQIKKGNASTFLEAADYMQYYEEKMIKGMVIASLSVKDTVSSGDCSLEDIFSYMHSFIPVIDNWGVCDTFCAGMKITKKYKKEMWDFLQPYWKAEGEFEVRTAIVMTMDYYIESEYLDVIFKLCDALKREEYYICMAQAWLLSVCYVKYEVETMQYLKNNHLNAFTYRKTLQKILESNRVSKEKKQLIRKMKK